MKAGMIIDVLICCMHVLGGLFVNAKAAGLSVERGSISVGTGRSNEGSGKAGIDGGKGGRTLTLAAIAGCIGVTVLAGALMITKPGNLAVALPASEVICMWACSIYFFKANRRMSLFLAIYYQIAMQLITFVACALAATALEMSAFLESSALQNQVVSMTVGLIGLAGCALVFYTNRLSARVCFRICGGIAILAICVINYLSVIPAPGLDQEDLTVWMFFAVGLMMAVLFLQMNRQYEMEKELASMKADEAQLLEREYHSLSRSYESNAKLFHDFRNHCGVLKNYLAKGKTQEALQYLEDLTGEGQTLEQIVWTGDETVDYLISSKKALAEEKQIAFEAQVEFPRNINIKSSDLCAILGNLLDNALEASSKLEEPGSRRIRLVIRRIQQMLVIKVENTYLHKPVVVEGRFQTSKTDGGLHGWGIRSAQTAAEKYDGMVQSSCTEELFTTVVTLSFEGIK